MNFSTFGNKFLGDRGMLRLMQDIGKGIGQEDTIMLGGGNPAPIPAIQSLFRDQMATLLDSDRFDAMLGNYSPPAGDHAFIQALTALFQKECNWDITPDHILLTNSSQTSFFYLFNLFAGAQDDGSHKKILFPLAPEYIGYEDVGIHPDIFTSQKPTIELLPDQLFKYHVDFSALEITSDIAAIAVSRPTNPTGNVLTQAEITQLSTLAHQHNIPFIIDNAYGLPFPAIIYTDEPTPEWQPHIIYTMSLSKLGLPGTRTGIIIANPDIINALRGMSAILALSPNSIGANLCLNLVKSGEILRVSQQIIKPYYHQMAQQALDWLRESCQGVPLRIHKPEGAFFFWLWLDNLPITAHALYQRLIKNGLIVVPGNYFFPGLDMSGETDGVWSHTQQCLRMNYAQPADQLKAGIQILADTLKEIY